MFQRRLLLLAVTVVGWALAGWAPGAERVRAQSPPRATMTIEEYEPRSTLVVASHAVPRARFPVVDVHSHQPADLGGVAFDRRLAEMDALNLRVLVNLSGGTGESLRRGIEARRGHPQADRLVSFANLDLSQPVGPGYGTRAAARLEADVRAGARGLKLFKNLGLRVRRADGERLAVDDPELDPVWQACARLRIPVLIHTGEPAAFFEPVDRHNERWLELALRPERRVTPPPSFEDLVAERDRLFARHPATTFIVAHLGWHGNDLARLGRLLDERPNVFTETGAVLAELGRQPRTAAAFLAKYQDRILFGKDAYVPGEYPYFWRTFETTDEYFDYYRKYHAFWKLYGLGLPDPVLKKLYFANAVRLVPGLPVAGWPAL
jgi:predicted TIM-barrel fold metal-dependent hydrolase